MLRVVFDLQALQNESRGRGIGRYCLNLFQALARRKDIELYALFNDAFTDELAQPVALASKLVGPENVIVFKTISPSAEVKDENLTRKAVNERLYEELLGSVDFDFLLVGSLFEGFLEETVTSLEVPYGNYRSAVILYDLIPLIDQEKFLGWDKARRWYFDRLVHLRRADLLLSISDSARREAIEQGNFDRDRVVSVGTAIDKGLFNREQRPAGVAYLRKLGITKPFVMHASALEERKNFEGLIQAFAAMPKRVRTKHQLLLIGRSEEDAVERLRSVARKCKLEDDEVIFGGYVSDQKLAGLYRSCSLFVFPSFHEGFGLPALEAMACGCPTIGSSRSSIPEVIGRDDLLFDPSDVRAMAKLMTQILTSPAKRAELGAHAQSFSERFSWDSVADRLVLALRELPLATDEASVSLERSVAALGKYVSQLSEPDRLSLASALVHNEHESFRVGALWGRQRNWRVEGPFDSSYSLALLNRETARALNDIGFEVALHSTEGPGDFEPSSAYLAEHPDLTRFHSRAARRKAKRADCVTRLLYPPRVHDIEGKRRGLHHYAWEETGFPQHWVEEFNSSLSFMTCLSRHVEKVMIDNGVTVPLLTSGCGVDHWERVDRTRDFAVSAKSFKFLHVSSCFPRKGADTLLRAYGAAFSAADDVSLIIKTFDNPHNNIEDQLAALKAASPDYPDVVILKQDLSEGDLKALYEQSDVMVAPSCAEGYGLPLAEAMLSGLPVITTNWGGQLDFCNSGNSWLVDFAFEKVQSHFGIWNSAWARPHVNSLAEAMVAARNSPPAERSAMARRGRDQLLATHKWIDAARRLATAARQLPGKRRNTPRVGWISTWNSKCGIAEYSRHILEKFDLPVSIFAPDNEEMLSRKDDSIRAWSLSKTNGRLCDVLNKHGAACDVFVIQFNYGFYDHSDLSRFIRQAAGSGKSVIIVLHSTVDPSGQDKPESYNLEFITPALRLCDRILVHSINDLNRLKALGLVDNAALFPHGVIETDEHIACPRKGGALPIIGTYGFALPNKGLEEIVSACHILSRQGRPVKLKMVNAEYPTAVSRAIVSDLQLQIHERGLRELVETHHDFLPSGSSLELLRQCDIIVFPYQKTGESSSASVRYGLATGVPVAVTPLPIFADVRGAVYSLAGTRPDQIASGLLDILDHVRARDEVACEIEAAARSWREAHLYSKVARRLANICTAVSRRSELRQLSRIESALTSKAADDARGIRRNNRRASAQTSKAEALGT